MVYSNKKNIILNCIEKELHSKLDIEKNLKEILNIPNKKSQQKFLEKNKKI